MMLENIVANLAWITLGLLIVAMIVLLVVAIAITIKTVITHWRDK